MDTAMRNNNSSSDGAVRNNLSDFTSFSSDQLTVSGSTVAMAISGIVCGVFVTCICCLCGYSKVKKVRTRNLESTLAPVTVITTSQLMTQISVQDYPPPYSPPPEFPGDTPLQYPTSPTNYSLSPAQPWAPSRHLTLQIPLTRSSQVYPETPPPTYMQLAAFLNWEVFPVSGQHVSPVSGQQVSSVSGQQVSPVSGQHVSSVSGHQVSLVSGQQVSPASGQQLSPVNAQQVSSMSGQQVSPVSGQQVSPASGQQ